MIQLRCWHNSEIHPGKPTHLQVRQLVLRRRQLSRLQLSGRQQLIVRSGQQLLKLHLSGVQRGHCSRQGWGSGQVNGRAVATNYEQAGTG